MDLKDVSITWLGHATFLFDYEGKQILLDPWLQGNPKCPEAYYDVEPDAILITHGHGDHVSDVFSVADRTDGPIVGIFDLTTWLESEGVDPDRMVGMNKGGTVRLDGLGVSVTMTDARHSSSTIDDDGTPVYLGEPAGYVIHFDSGLRIYAAGDTCLFGDMEWIGRMYEPQLAILPIGDRFTMDPKAAFWACELVGNDAVIPCHWGTFPLLTGTPEQFEDILEEMDLNIEVLAMEPGQTL